MYNRIILIGNLTKDPELRYTPQGTPVASFRIAVNTRYKQSEEQREDTLFIDIVTFGKQAETCSQYLNKGKSVLVEGRLQERRWESDGQQKSKFEVIAQTVRFLSRKGAGEGQGGSGSTTGDVPPDGTTDVEPF
jgi:single-strand DNA-binding protein